MRLATQAKPARTSASAPAVALLGLPVWLVAPVLALATLVLYWPTTGHEIVNYDDDIYVTANARVQSGLSLANMKWACVNPVCCNWHPLTVSSHMLDCQLYGLKPWGHHLTSVLLQADAGDVAVRDVTAGLLAAAAL